MKKELTPDLIFCCLKSFNYLLDFGEVPPGDYVAYEILETHGFIKVSNKQKRAYRDKAKALMIKEDSFKHHTKRKPNLYKNRAKALTFRAKALILQDYFLSIINSGKHLKDIL